MRLSDSDIATLNGREGYLPMIQKLLQTLLQRSESLLVTKLKIRL